MVREKKRGLTHLIFAFLLLATAAQAEDPSDTLLIGIGEVPQDARDCTLQHGDANPCDPYYQGTLEALQKINEAIDSGLKKNSRDGIDVAIPYNENRAWLLQTGVHLGALELTIDEVRSDPVRRAIDDERRARNATSGSWVRHTIEIRPSLSLGFKPDADGPAAVNNLFLGFLPQFSIQIQVIKHYDLPVDFPVRPKERAQSFKKLFTEHFKNYLQLPTELGGGGLDPGESVQLESYMSATSLPSLANQFASLNVGGFPVGAFTRLGFEYFQTIRYRRYTIQKLSGNKLRMVLESPDIKRWGPFADIGVHADLILLFDLDVSLTRAGYRWIREKNFTSEYIVDLTNAEARKALKRAYLWGDFGPADQLADEDCKNATGIHKTSQTDAKSGDLGTHAHGWRIKVLRLAIGNTHSKTDEVETPVFCTGFGPSVTSHADELQKIREGFRATRTYNVGIRTLKSKTNSRSLWVKFNFNGSSSSRDEMLEFLRIANLIAESGDNENLAMIKTELDTVSAQPNDSRTGRVHAYLSLEFDAAAISTILSMKEEDRAAALRAAYNKLMGADNEKSYPDPDKYKDHLRDLEKFLAAARRGVSQPDDLAGAKAFLEGIERTGLDLYPFAAILAALPNADHVLSTAQIYLAGKTRDEDRLIDPSHAGRLFNQNDPVLVENADVPSQP